MLKNFPCGHQGKGQYCHRCQQEEKEKRSMEYRRQEWINRLKSSPVKVDHLPRGVAEKALDIFDKLKRGESYHDVGGKRLSSMKWGDIISIPIFRKYRIVCREVEGELKYIEVIVHAKYDIRIAAGGWGR